MNGRALRWVVYAVIVTVAVFAFIVSYSHIYDLGRGHAQSGVAARLLPLSVDLLIVAASLVLFIQYRENGDPRGLARWLPRLTLYAAIGATVAANVFYGLPHGWLAAVISGWPGVAFVAAVEVGMVIARPAAQPRKETASAGASVKPKLPPLREVQDGSYSGDRCGQTTAGKIRTALRTRDTQWAQVLERSRGGTPHSPAAPAARGTPAGVPAAMGTAPAPAGALNGQSSG